VHYIQVINKNTFKNKKEDNSSMEAWEMLHIIIILQTTKCTSTSYPF
jgi:hypothetical protein